MSVLDDLGGYRVRLWFCPKEMNHWPDRGAGRHPVVKVEWRDDVAYCMYPGCEINSASGIVLCDLCGAVREGIFWRSTPEVPGIFLCHQCVPCSVCGQRGGYCFVDGESQCRVQEALSNTWEPSERLWMENVLYHATVTSLFYMLYDVIHGLDQRVQQHVA